MIASRLSATALYGSDDLLATEPLTGPGLPVTIAGVIADATRARGGFACASPVTTGAGGAPG